MLFACLASLALASSAPTQDPAAAPRPTAPADEAQVRAACRGILDRLVARGVPGASAAVVLPDGRVVAVASGLADADAELALTTDHRLLSGSVGKTYVTALAHRLVHAGKLELDTRVAEVLDTGVETAEELAWLDAVPNAREVTLRQLLRHTTGIPRYVFEEAFLEALLAAPDRVWEPEELLTFVHGAAPLFAPDEGWAYSDTNYIVVGILIERVTGRRYYDLVREELLEPLGLTDTVPTDRRRIPGMAQGHVVAGLGMGVPERTLADGTFVYNVQFEWCGGGFASTPSDLARWAGLLYSGRAFDAPYLDTLLDTVPAPNLGPDVEYGLGAMVRTTPAGRLVHHDGFMPGYLTSAGWFPELGIAAALQVNGDDSRALGSPPSAILAELAGAARTGTKD